ncbi:hypothetical protein NQ315_008739 [Exocentrus adspersus]|uniref:Uncharacterized protein n=1 Tax=Exocentrus adspersus TaxID=1586481 RepID=A0AAV8VGJ9_9CUCU|nr:hypothetical protein NQ315_008739 [Exocentrus adspersus]
MKCILVMYSVVIICPKSAQAPMRRYCRENPVKYSLLSAARVSIHRDTDERVTHRSPPRAAVETKIVKVAEAPTGILAKTEKPPRQKYSKSGSAGFATDPAAQTQAEAQVYPGLARRKSQLLTSHYYEQTCLQPAQEPTPNQQVHVGVNPVVLLGFTVAVLSRRVHSDDPPY